MNEDVIVCPLFETSASGKIPASAKDLIIGKISTDTAMKLNMLWHSRLPLCGNSFCCFGYCAEYDNRYYAIALWSNPVAANRLKDGDKILELRRMAIADNAPKFTATRMISIMMKDIKKTRPDIIRLISYQDTEVHKGTIYKASNWKAVSVGEGMSWTTNTRQRNQEQTLAPKIRWEYEIRKNKVKTFIQADTEPEQLTLEVNDDIPSV